MNHIGDDLSRGLLLFAEARELSAEGLRWLKIHLAGLFGFDKASFKEREEWVQEHLEDIRDCAEKPLTGRRWWSQADDPWQFLAACRELINALDSPDPLAYKSPLPIHQDGTCNGLQHYAALGGDLDGAKQVNLVSGDKPSDVYTHVAQLVEKTIEADIEKGVEIAKLVQGKISRKVVKQTVMTTVYGVTFVGARDQIARQLKDKRVIPLDRCWEASAYIAKNVSEAKLCDRLVDTDFHLLLGSGCYRQSVLWSQGNHELVLRMRSIDFEGNTLRSFRPSARDGW